jgi:hypothetical protein
MMMMMMTIMMTVMMTVMMMTTTAKQVAQLTVARATALGCSFKSAQRK